jgi:hypothetical protein
MRRLRVSRPCGIRKRNNSRIPVLVASKTVDCFIIFHLESKLAFRMTNWVCSIVQYYYECINLVSIFVFFIPLTLYPLRCTRGISDIRPTFYQIYLAMSNSADVTGSNPIVVLSQSISGAFAINPLVAFYDIHGRKREVLFFYFVPDTTRDFCIYTSSSFLPWM